jgi:UDP-N-acetyl-D-galactosamine dehydrogenase
VNAQEVKHEYDIQILNSLPNGNYAAVILAVAHKEFLDLDIRSLTPRGIVFDVKGILSKNIIDSRL